MNLNAAGIEVGADAPGVAMPPDRDAQPVQRFGAFTAALYALAAWLRQCQIGDCGDGVDRGFTGLRCSKCSKSAGLT